MSLKNVTRINSFHHGKKSWSLIDDDGDCVLAFEYYAVNLANRGHPFTTRKRYAEVVSKFIDYLYEAGAFSAGVTQSKLNEVIQMYPIILEKGKEYDWVTFSKQAENEYLGLNYNWVPDVVNQLDFMGGGLMPGSFDNVIAPINTFLNICEVFKNEQYEKAKFLGIEGLPSQLKPLIKAVDGFSFLSSREKKNIKQSSVLGSVLRIDGKSMSRPAGLKNRSKKVGLVDIARLDFPIKEFGKLLDACRSHRDRAMWLLACGTGIRSSEVRNMMWGDIDIDKLKVWVADPEGLRFGKQMTKEENIRFKGRKYSMTYFIRSFQERFFYELEMYLKHEYTGSVRNNDYVFQYIYGKKRGEPLVGVTDAGFINLFKRAVKRAGIETPFEHKGFSWTPHSLRHAYAVYMLNDIQLSNGKKGLKLEEVQMLMGHESIMTTRHYAKNKVNELHEKLEKADRAMFEELSDESILEYNMCEYFPILEVK